MERTSLRNLLFLGGKGSGSNSVKGTFTCPATGSSFELSFGKTFGKYVAIVEMTDDSKTELMGTGITASRTFALMTISSKMVIGELENNYQTLCFRVNPSAETFDTGVPTNLTFTDSSMTMPMGTTGSANQLYQGYSYNYYVTEVE